MSPCVSGTWLRARATPAQLRALSPICHCLFWVKWKVRGVEVQKSLFILSLFDHGLLPYEGFAMLISKLTLPAFWVLLCQVNLLSRKNMSALFPARNCCWDLIDNCVSRLLPTLFLFSLIPVFSVGLCGTKLGCGEGGCGACTVMISKYDPFQKKIMYPLQSGLWQSVKWNGDSSRLLTYCCFKRCYIMYVSAKTSFFIFRI